MGPGGGVNGGEIVVEGTPEVVAAEPKSFTGQYLKPLLQRSVRPEPIEGLSSPSKKPRRKAPSEPDLPDLIPAK
jgi:hypothetical protein